jgi:hypothetical protein
VAQEVIGTSAHQHGLSITAFNYAETLKATMHSEREAERGRRSAGDGVGDWNTSCINAESGCKKIRDQLLGVSNSLLWHYFLQFFY